MKAAPNMDGQLTPADVDAVAAYVWAISHHRN
jgi:mono/diheme cytochrome c family protein